MNKDEERSLEERKSCGRLGVLQTCMSVKYFPQDLALVWCGCISQQLPPGAVLPPAPPPPHPYLL